MKNLLVMRHAKSSWKDPSLDDHDRPLNGRGNRDAPRMGRLLEEAKLIPDCILTSTARRARRTAELVAEQLPVHVTVSATDDLYHASADEWSRQIQNLPRTASTVLCIGHNPGLEDFLASATNRYVAMPTAAIAHLVVKVNQWSEVRGSGDAELLTVWRLKDLPGE